MRLPHPPRWPEVQRRPFASDPNGGSSPTTTKARRPILLVEMIQQGRKARFSLQRGETRPKGSSRRDGNPGYQRRREEKTSVLKNSTFSCQSSVGWLAGSTISAPRQDRLTPRPLPPSARSRMSSNQMYLSLSLVKRKAAQFSHNRDEWCCLVWLKCIFFMNMWKELLVFFQILCDIT